VDIRGDCDRLPALTYHGTPEEHSDLYPDPLVLPTASWLRDELLDEPAALERLRAHSPHLVDDEDLER
jgi:hypothetical protein